jgi:hypothetical protein
MERRWLKPVHPFEVDGSGWGAWDIASRLNIIELNDRLATANGIAGGRQTVYTAALNWYVNREHTFYAGLLAWPCRQAGITHLACRRRIEVWRHRNANARGFPGTRTHRMHEAAMLTIPSYCRPWERHAGQHVFAVLYLIASEEA